MSHGNILSPRPTGMIGLDNYGSGISPSTSTEAGSDNHKEEGFETRIDQNASELVGLIKVMATEGESLNYVEEDRDKITGQTSSLVIESHVDTIVETSNGVITLQEETFEVSAVSAALEEIHVESDVKHEREEKVNDVPLPLSTAQLLRRTSTDSQEDVSKQATNEFGIFLTSDRAGVQLDTAVVQERARKEASREHKWDVMLQHWEREKRFFSARLSKRVRKGIPNSRRAAVWQLLSGSDEMMKANPGRYQELLAQDIKVEGPIEEDLPRTMFDHEMFCRRSQLGGIEKLRRILLAYGRYDRVVQYCQGINYITALFLMYMPEEESFWMLVSVMYRERAPLRELFLPGMMKAREFNKTMDSLTEKFVPRLHAHLRRHDIDLNMYAYPWFVTCFTQSFAYDLVTRVWDVFLLEDWKIMYRVCLALFKYIQDEVCAVDLEHGNLILRKLPSGVDAQMIMDTAWKLPLKHKHIIKRVRRFYAEIQQAVPSLHR